MRKLLGVLILAVLFATIGACYSLCVGDPWFYGALIMPIGLIVFIGFLFLLFTAFELIYE